MVCFSESWRYCGVPWQPIYLDAMMAGATNGRTVIKASFAHNKLIVKWKDLWYLQFKGNANIYAEAWHLKRVGLIKFKRAVLEYGSEGYARSLILSACGYSVSVWSIALLIVLRPLQDAAMSVEGNKNSKLYSSWKKIVIMRKALLWRRWRCLRLQWDEKSWQWVNVKHIAYLWFFTVKICSLDYVVEALE